MSSMPSPAELAGRHVLLALSGGIACYKAADLCRELVKAGATVQVAMSQAATRFVTPVTLQALSGRPVHVDMWDPRVDNNMAHIDLTRGADLMLVAPASADLFARLAQGRADELVGLLALARPETMPLLLAPAMNRQMWLHPATRRNVAQVQADGARVLGPGQGEQACGEVGDGRMLEPAELLEGVIAALTPQRLAGRRVVITAGPTFEPIDPVRGITNHSSGKMGFAIARAAAQAGADVQLVAGPVHLPTPAGVRRIDVQQAAQMHAVVLREAPGADVFIASAAVADWRPQAVAAHKIKKDGSGQAPTIAMAENPDILADVARLPTASRPYCVGFAAESQDVVALASAKRVRKAIPLIVANHGPSTFGRDDNAITLIDERGAHELPPASKQALARELVAEIAGRLPPRRT